jgi:hypothetical protein
MSPSQKFGSRLTIITHPALRGLDQPLFGSRHYKIVVALRGIVIHGRQGVKSAHDTSERRFNIGSYRKQYMKGPLKVLIEEVLQLHVPGRMRCVALVRRPGFEPLRPGAILSDTAGTVIVPGSTKARIQARRGGQAGLAPLLRRTASWRGIGSARSGVSLI